MIYKLRLKSLILGISLSLSLLSGCTKDYLTGTEDATAKFEIKLNISNSNAVDTRSEGVDPLSYAENFIAKGYVFIFDSKDVNSKAIAVHTITMSDIIDNGTSSPKISVPLSITAGNIVKFIFNVTPIDPTFNINNISIANFNSSFKFGTTGFAVPYDKSNPDSGLPMFGEIGNWNASSPSVTITRKVAKIQVQLPAGGLSAENDITGDFSNLDFATFSLHKLTADGHIQHDPDHNYTYQRRSKEYKLSYTGDKYTDAQYIYAYPYSTKILNKRGGVGEDVDPTVYNEDRFCIIITRKNSGIEPLFYRIDLLHQDSKDIAPQYFDINSNSHYTITITKVKTLGYDDLDETLKFNASNIEYTTDVHNPYTDGAYNTNIISNGSYAVSFMDGTSRADKYIYRTAKSEFIVEFLTIFLDSKDQYMNPIYIAREIKVEQIGTTSNIGVSIINFNTYLVNNTTVPLNLKITGYGKARVTIHLKAGSLRRFTATTYIDKSKPLHSASGEVIELSGQVAAPIDGGDNFLSATNSGPNTIRLRIPDNTTPYSWKLWNNTTKSYDYVPDGSNDYAVPQFRSRVFNGYIKNKDNKKILVQMDQLAPIYIGRWGSPEVGVEEDYMENGQLYTEIGRPIRKRAIITARNAATIEPPVGSEFGQGESFGTFYGGLPNYINNGFVASTNTGSSGTHNASQPAQLALHRCYKENADYTGAQMDKSKVKWYLPAQVQLTGYWVSVPAIGYDGDQKLFNDNMSNIFWSATHNNSNVMALGASYGTMIDTPNRNLGSVRCIMDLD